MTPEFKNAITDYQYLTERGYANKSLVKWIGDHYKLSSVERSFLYRGITSNTHANRRKLKLVGEKELTGTTLHIDTYNVLLTVFSYLKGRPVFISNDAFLRDANELKSKITQASAPDRAVNLMLSYLQSSTLSGIKFYIDQPVPNSKYLNDLLKKMTINFPVKTTIQTTENVDRKMITLKSGVLVSSDSEIIDQSYLPFFDLAKYTLIFHFKPRFINLQQMNL